MDAFEKIYIAYKEDIYRFICKLTNYNYNLSEELLAETFFQAFIAFERFRGECEVKTWLCQIARNVYAGYVRKEVRKQHLFEHIKGNYEHTKGAVSPWDLSQQAEAHELLCFIQMLLGECNKRAQDIVLYRMYAGLKFKEIAKILDIKETTAKVIFYRTKVYIQNQLKERFGYEI